MYPVTNKTLTNLIPITIKDMIIVIMMVTIIIINGFEINEEACIYLLFTINFKNKGYLK